ncbi:MAG: AAA domain-containing protein [Proteobacteria bacterium]|nr:AAA domain-containing protein [Pseudomonadota bacterium]
MIDENVFFREATMRICGNLEIDKALRECLLYIRDYIPADFMAFIIYLPDEGCYETIAVARLTASNTLPVKVPVTVREQEHLSVNFTDPRLTISNWNDGRRGESQALKHLGWPKGSSIIIEMVLSGKRMGALIIIDEKKGRYAQDHARLLSLLNEPLGIALTNSIRYRKVRELKNLLADDKQYLQNELLQMTERKIVGSEYGLKGVMESVHQVAPMNSPVLLLGETGVGKEVVARAIHNASQRREGPFIKVNCGAISESLVDSELFGHEKGAFTGAISQKRGRFERAEGGTIFLDEIGELPLEVQVRLLRVLQDKEIERVGAENTIRVDCRIIAATHRHLEDMIDRGRFREDLYFRLRIFPIVIPPLRERKADIPLLVQHFIQKKSRELALPGIPTLAPSALERLIAHDWPGNVRELENSVERALIINRNTPLAFDDLRYDERGGTSVDVSSVDQDFPALDEMVSRHIRQALLRARGRIEGRAGAAELLALNPGTLRQKMRKLGIPFGRNARGHYKNTD